MGGTPQISIVLDIFKCTFTVEKMLPNKLPVIAVCYYHVSFLSARDIKIVKDLQNASVSEKESVTFICEVNWEDVDGKWYKDDSRLKAGDNVKIRCEGMCERHFDYWWMLLCS